MSDFFSTQELIQEFEPAFTPALFERSLLVVGLGGNGTHLALAAVRMGFARVVGVDCDLVSESNLSRQVLYTRQDVGRRKAEAAREALARHNLRSVIETHDLDILAQRRRHFGDLVAAADLVFVVLDQQIALEGGHPSTYPTACLGSNLMMAVALNVLLGKGDVPRLLELSLLGPALEARSLRQRANCPTCSPGPVA